MPADRNTFKSPGDINITRISLHKKPGDDGINLTQYLFELNLFEDLFSPTMSGTMLITDSIGLSSRLPLVGGESVQIAYNTPEIGEYGKITKRFIVYKLESKVAINSKTIYVLHIISEFAYMDSMKKLSRKYTGPAVKIIKEILEKELKFDINRDGFSYNALEENRNFIEFVAPNWSPLTVINRVTAMCSDQDSLSTDGELASYLFFESAWCLNFFSLTDLIGVDDTDESGNNIDTTNKVAKENTFFYDQNPNRVDGMRDYYSEMQQIKDMRVDAQFDMLDRLTTGFYKNQVIEFDIIKKHVNILKPYEYLQTFKGGKYSMNDFTVNPENMEVGDGKYNSHTTFNRALAKKDISINPVKNRVCLGLLNTVSMEIVVHGRSDLSVGTKISINMPSSVSPDSSSSSVAVDKLISGTYLITAVQHRINEFKHSMILRISTDSYGMDTSK